MLHWKTSPRKPEQVQYQSRANHVTCERFVGSETHHSPKHTYSTAHITLPPYLTKATTEFQPNHHYSVTGLILLPWQRGSPVMDDRGSAAVLQDWETTKRKRCKRAVTFELGVMGLAQQSEVGGVSQGHTQRWWSADLKEVLRDLQRMVAIMLSPALLRPRFKVI